MALNKNTVSGKMKEVKGQVREQWGKATNDPKQVIKGNAEQAVGKAQQGVGELKERAKTSVIDAVDKAKGRDRETYTDDPMATNKRTI